MKHTIVVGLSFGDESKGATVDHLCDTQNVSAVVRFSGGPQTLHHVVLPDGRFHGFSQFGSGTLRGVPTIHTRFSLINPFNMVKEAEHLTDVFGINDPFGNVWFDENCLVITPLHQHVNRAREIARGASRHGSCGQGVGVAQEYAINSPGWEVRLGDLIANWGSLRNKLSRMQSHFEMVEGVDFKDLNGEDIANDLWSWAKDINPMIMSSALTARLIHTLGAHNPLVFEGTQGVLLDEWYGFHPHTTWSTTTFRNAETVLTEAGFTRDQWTRLGLTRAYTTRHGAGPLPGEDETLTAELLEDHNATGTYQGAWRVSPLDEPLLKYAVNVCGGIDEIGVSHLDVIPAHADASTGGGIPVIRDHGGPLEEYPAKTEDQLENLEIQEVLTEYLFNLDKSEMLITNEDRETILAGLEIALGAPVTLTSTGKTSADRVYTPPWV